MCLSGSGDSLSLEAIEDMITSYVCVSCGIRQLSPHSIQSTYLPGVAAKLDMMRSPSKFLFRHAMNGKEVKLVIAGFKRAYDKKNPRADKLRLPFGVDLAMKSRQVMKAMGMYRRYEKDEDILIERVFVSEVVGINFLLRKSEHIMTKGKGAAAPLRRKHVVSFDKDNRHIHYNDVGRSVKAQSVVLNVTFAKADQSGYGRRTRHTRQPQHPDTCAVSILERWIATTRESHGCVIEDPLYYLPKYGALTTNELHTAMQATVTAYSGDKFGKRVTSHSLRYGGATMLAAAGLPHYIIAMYGGWSQDSQSLKLYTKPSTNMVNIVSRHMASMGNEDSSIYFINDAYVISQGGYRDEGM